MRITPDGNQWLKKKMEINGLEKKKKTCLISQTKINETIYIETLLEEILAVKDQNSCVTQYVISANLSPSLPIPRRVSRLNMFKYQELLCIPL